MTARSPVGRPPRPRPDFLSGTATYLLSNALAAAIPFVLLPVLARVLGPEQYGQVGMFQMLVSALAAFTGLCVHSAANRKYYDAVDDKEVAAFVGACLRILAFSSLALFGLASLALKPLSEWSGLSPEWVLAAVATSAGGVVVNLRLGQWQVRGMAARYGRFQVLQGLSLMLLALTLVVGLGAGAGGRILAQLVVVAGCAGVAFASLRKDRLATFERRLDLTREALAFGVPLIPHVAGVFLLGTVDRAVINQALGLEQVGIYVVAVQLALVLALVFDAVNKAYVPWLFERLARNEERDKRAIVRLTYGHFVLALAAAGILAVLGPYIVPLAAGAPYSEAATAFGWLALGQAFSGMYLMVTNYVQFARRTGALSVVTIMAGALNIALLLWLVPLQGVRGAGIAFATAMALRFLATWWLAHRVHPMPWLPALSLRPPAG